MPERHTAEYMANVLQVAVEDLGIADRVAACVHYNASNKFNGSMSLIKRKWQHQYPNLKKIVCQHRHCLKGKRRAKKVNK